MMTDLEMTKLCAEAMGATEWGSQDQYGVVCRIDGLGYCLFNPLHHDGQMAAVVKKFGLSISNWRQWDSPQGRRWHVEEHVSLESGTNRDLNRAVVECAARAELERRKRR